MTLPLRILTPYAEDLDTIRQMTPGPGGGPPNTFVTLRAAAGVCRDVRRHLAFASSAVIVDFRGNTVPDEAWLPDLIQVRGR